MIQVKNKKIINTLSKRFMVKNKARNIVLTISILLTTTLFTTIFFSAYSMIESSKETEIRDTMCSAHASAQTLTTKEYTALTNYLEKDSSITRIGRGRFLGLAINPDLRYQLELRYADKILAESFNCPVTTGRMPKSSNEIACSTLALSCLGIEPKLGEQVTLNIFRDNTDEEFTKTFTLCGYFKGDKSTMAQLAWLSEDFVNKYCPKDFTSKSEGYTGSYEISIWFDSTFQLEKKTNHIAEKFPTLKDFTSNPAYIVFTEDGFSIPSFLMLAGIIFTAGYLIIYNIFNISIKNDIKTYGLLKNIGVTASQMFKIVYQQALRLCITTLPVGLLLGYGITYLLTPILLADPDHSEGIVSVCPMNPLVFIVSAMITIITVFLGFLKPCITVQKLSPIEALHYADRISTTKVHKKKRKVSPIGIGLSSIRKNFAKGLLIILSICLALTILNGSEMIASGLDFKEYVANLITNDIKINKISEGGSFIDYQGISKKQIETIKNCPGIKNIDISYYNTRKGLPDKSLLKHLISNDKKYWEELKKVSPKDYKKHKEATGTVSFKDTEVSYDIIGLNEGMFNQLIIHPDETHTLTWEEFSSGDYALVSYPYSEFGLQRSYDVGETVTAIYENGATKDYCIGGTANLPYNLEPSLYRFCYVILYVPDTSFMDISKCQDAMNVCLDVEKGYEKEAQQYIKEQLQEQDDLLIIRSLGEYRKEFRQFINKYQVLGKLLAGIIGIIGIMNFVNASMTSIIARKRELSLLEVVGMTKKQILTMLITEGIFYIFTSFLLAVIICHTLIKTLIYHTVGMMFYLHLEISIIPSVIILPFLLIFAFIIPYFGYKKVEQQSVIERINNNL